MLHAARDHLPSVGEHDKPIIFLQFCCTIEQSNPPPFAQSYSSSRTACMTNQSNSFVVPIFRIKSVRSFNPQIFPNFIAFSLFSSQTNVDILFSSLTPMQFEEEEEWRKELRNSTVKVGGTITSGHMCSVGHTPSGQRESYSGGHIRLSQHLRHATITHDSDTEKSQYALWC